MPVPEYTEGTHTLTFIVEIDCYGKPEQLQQSISHALSQILHQSFRDEYRLSLVKPDRNARGIPAYCIQHNPRGAEGGLTKVVYDELREHENGREPEGQDSSISTSARAAGTNGN